MSRPRQPDAITSLARAYGAGATVAPHVHDTDQLVYGTQGVMTVQTPAGVWVTPPVRAVWIPAGVPHSIRMSGAVAMRTLYFRPDLLPALPRRCCPVEVSNLLKELILHVCARQSVAGSGPDERGLIRFLAGRIQDSRVSAIDLPSPRDPRAQRVARELVASEGWPAPIEGLCREAGVSRRSLERIFVRETGLSLGRWRRQARLVQALEGLARGASVSQVAFDAGYASASAFCVAFRRALGATPADYFRSRE